MPVRKTLEGGRVPVKIWTEAVDRASQDQLRNLARLPFVFKHVAAMPDVHLGIGATVGSVIATRGAVIPAAVGVDIGCGMVAAKLKGADVSMLEGRLGELRAGIERAVPVGFASNRAVAPDARAWKGWEDYDDLHPAASKLRDKAMKQMGSLGSGNHFIEVCREPGGAVWAMLHSGSRNLGKTLAEAHISKAKSLIKRLSEKPPDPDLAHFAEGTPEFRAYMRDLLWLQDYAAQNRRVMLERVLRELMVALGDRWNGVEATVQCHHNFARVERHFGREVIVTRKGAVRAGKGELGILPGSMGTRSYIVRGKGSPESFESCAHGAGRAMSRRQAKRTFGVAELRAQTRGVECRKDAGVLDEIPAAYKPIERVMADQSDLVEPVAELKQVLCVKG